MAQSIITHFLCLRLPLQASPPEEFDTSHTSKLWAVEQLLRYCAAHNEKLVLVGERYGCGWRWQCGRGFARESGASQAPAATSFFFWDSCKTLFGLLPCSLDYLGEIEQLLERLQLCMAGAPPSACATATFFRAGILHAGTSPACHGPVCRCVCLPADHCCRRPQTEVLQD